MPSVQQKTANRASRREVEAAGRAVDDELSELMDLHRSASEKIKEAISALEETVGFALLLEEAASEAKREDLKASSFRDVAEGVASIAKALSEVTAATGALVEEKRATSAILKLHAGLCRRLESATVAVASASKTVSRMGSSFDNAPWTSTPAYNLSRRLRIPDVVRTVHAATSNLSRISKMSRALASFHSRAVQDIARGARPHA
jgi:hypothetical protein